MKKLLIIICALLLAMQVVAATKMDVYVRPLISGVPKPSTNFQYTFDFTTDAACLNVLWSDTQNVTTDSTGVGFVQLDITGLSSTPSYICEYRNGNLRKVHEVTSLMADKIIANTLEANINASRVLNPPWLTLSNLTINETDPVFTGSLAYNITSGDVGNWNAAYGWGDHSLAGYITGYNETDPSFNAWLLATPPLYSFTELDPYFAASLAYNITSGDVGNWNAAYGWGDHSLAGYITGYNETDPSFNAWLLATPPLYSYTETDPIFSGQNASIWGAINNKLDAGGGIINGSLTIIGDLTVIGNVVNLTVTNIDTNGSILPSLDSLFDLGAPGFYWNNVYANNLYGSLNASYITNAPWLLSFSELDPQFTGSVAYNITSGDIINWNAAYGWGDHSIAGYLVATANNCNAGEYSRFNGTGFECSADANTLYYNLSEFYNDAGFITGYNETDPVFTGSLAYNITSGDVGNWNAAYGWGDHSLAGYLVATANSCSPGEYSAFNGTAFNCYTDSGMGNETDPFFTAWNYNWYNLTNVPAGFADGIDNDTTYSNLSEFYDDVGFITGYNETDPVFTAENSTIWGAINNKLEASDQRYNDSARIDALNLSKLDVTDQRYNNTIKTYTNSQTITASSGSGTATTPFLPGFVITRIDVIPTTITNSYNFEALENGTSNAIDTNRILHTGNWQIKKYYAMNGLAVTYNIYNATIDEAFNVTITYQNNQGGI